MENSNEDVSKERFGFTVFLSACVHGILILGVGFTYLGELNSEPTLEITLAQYRSEVAPDNADFLAQENQVGSGTIDESVAPSTPFESDFNADTIQEVVPVPRASMSNLRESQDTAVITAVQSTARINQPLEKTPPEEELPLSDESTEEELSLAIASLQAQLDRQRQEHALRPRKYTISSASTKKSQDALYLDTWRRRIEAVGNVNYPDKARRDRLYGSLRLLVAILPDGKVDGIQLLQSSGHTMLDQAAMRIVEMASPFAPFPDEMLANVDILEIIRTWRFHEGNALTSF
ncbi:MAG TPA: energy transducer TonB [Gammaproteobacteria bacterium]|nr:energy transducer TonB [Gammaproteobacteria bacterium]